MNPSELFERGAITEQLSDFLVGRDRIITEVSNKLAEDKVSAVLYGMRGVGKTTIAWQIVSLLNGTSQKFKKSETLLYNSDLSYKIIFHKCSSTIETVGDLLIDIIFGSKGEFSFSNQLSSVLDGSKEINNSIKTKFGISLFKTVNFSREGVKSFETSY